jgi:CRISPR-associated protein Cmr5
MPSLQQTKEQERAARAWADVTGCLDQAIEVLIRQINSAKRRVDRDPDNPENQKRLEDLTKRLQYLQNPKYGREWQQSYASHVKKLPMLVLTNGLGPALAFLRAKGKNDRTAEEEALYQQMSKWVTAQIWGGEGDAGLLLKLIAPASGSDVYRRATVEALAFLEWLKRFAEAVLEPEPDLTMEEDRGDVDEPTTSP